MWLQLLSQGEWLWGHLLGARGHTIICFYRLGILYKYRAHSGNYLFDTAPVTGSLLLAASDCCLTDSRAAGLKLRLLQDSAVCRVLSIFRQLSLDIVMATGGDTPADD